MDACLLCCHACTRGSDKNLQHSAPPTVLMCGAKMWPWDATNTAVQVFGCRTVTKHQPEPSSRTSSPCALNVLDEAVNGGDARADISNNYRPLRKGSISYGDIVCSITPPAAALYPATSVIMRVHSSLFDLSGSHRAQFAITVLLHAAQKLSAAVPDMGIPAHAF